MRNFNSRRILFDTNILLDAIVEARPESEEAVAALRFCNGGGDLGFASSVSLKDVYYVLSKAKGEAFARIAIAELMDLLVIVPCGAEECALAAASNEPDFEDGLIRACAELNEVDFILTRDEKAFAKSRVRSVTCSEYLSIVA